MCKIENCSSKVRSKGLCYKHDYQLRITDKNHPSSKHGMWKTSEYSIWRAMRQRCNNPKSKDYARYGGRGIRVCPEWDKSFLAFYADMGARPDKLTLDRIDNDGNYELSNCKWSSRYEQAQNRSYHT